MSRYEQRKRQALRNPQVAAGYWEMDSELKVIEALAALRKQMHLPIEEVARRMDRHSAAISRLLNAQHPNPRLDTLSDLLAALGVTAEVHLRPSREGEPPITVDVEVDIPETGSLRERSVVSFRQQLEAPNAPPLPLPERDEVK